VSVGVASNTFVSVLVGGVLLGVTHPAKKPDRKIIHRNKPTECLNFVVVELIYK
jgi:hypothetical protein